MSLRYPTICVFLLTLACSSARALTLDSVLAETLQNNPHILQAKDGVEAAAGQRIVLRSLAYPKAVIGGVVGDQGGKRAKSSDNQPFIFGYGAASQTLFDAVIPAAFRRSDVSVLIAQQQLNVSVTEELHLARLAFYRALYYRSLESLGREQRDRLADNVASEEARYQAGESERAALTSAMLLVRELDPRIESAHNEYGGAVLELAQAMGQSLGPNAALPSPEGTLAFTETNLRWQDEVAHTLQTRADLKLARLLVRAANEDQRIAAAGYYPKINAFAAGDGIPVSGIYRDSGGSPQSSDNTVASEIALGAVYSWKVVDNGAVHGAVSREKANRETNKLELRKLEENIPRQLARLQNQMLAISARYHSLVQSSVLAEKNVASVQENRAHGLASILDFRSAESDLLIARRGVLSAIYEQNVALAEWDRITGRYFQFSEKPAKVH
jgi:outer membrane protein TolC